MKHTQLITHETHATNILYLVKFHHFHRYKHNRLKLAKHMITRDQTAFSRCQSANLTEYFSVL